MQPDQDSNRDWQKPRETTPQAPYEAVDDQEYGNKPLTDSDPQDKSDQLNSNDNSQSDDDTALLRWEGTEYIHQDRNVLWYVGVAAVSAILVAVALLVFRSITFAILVPVMSVALIIYVRRPPATLHYILSRKGLHVDDRLFSYNQFKSFGVVRHDRHHSVVLVPRKRFQIGQTIYFPEEIGEQLVDMLAARLPMKEVKPDFIDRLLERLRL
jgi:hypothetical protein